MTSEAVKRRCQPKTAPFNERSADRHAAPKKKRVVPQAAGG